MLEVKQCVTPSPDQWDIVIKGMRNAFKSWDKNDSTFCEGESYGYCGISNCPFWSMGNDGRDARCGKPKMEIGRITLGENDKKLLLNLTKLGTSDRKLLRQLPIILKVNAPLYWWKQADKYQIGTVTNSESTMHTIEKLPFTAEDFSLDHAEEVDEPEGCGSFLNLFLSIYLEDLNYLRGKYLETKEDKYKKLLIEILPESYNQARTWSLNYEVALQIIHQRKNHPLKEWEGLINYLLENVPYLRDIYEASCYQEITMKKLKEENNELRKENRELRKKLGIEDDK